MLVLSTTFFTRGVIASVTYKGTKGDISFTLKQPQPAWILPPIAMTLMKCATRRRCSIPTNQTGVSGTNRRGNEGFSRYNAVSAEIKTRLLHGLDAHRSYTYANWKDNSSS